MTSAQSKTRGSPIRNSALTMIPGLAQVTRAPDVALNEPVGRFVSYPSLALAWRRPPGAEGHEAGHAPTYLSGCPLLQSLGDFRLTAARLARTPTHEVAP